MSEIINYAQIQQAKVLVRGDLAGVLRKESESEYFFEYDLEWLRAGKGDVAISLYSSQTVHRNKILFPFFDNLIPEGWLLSYVEQIHKIDKRNRFALLLATGFHTIGAVSVLPITKDKVEFERYQSELSSTIEEKLLFPSQEGRCPYCLEDLPVSRLKRGGHIKCVKDLWETTSSLNLLLDEKEPLEVFRHTIYGASISGAQRKGLFQLKDNQLSPALTHDATIILKPQGDFPSLPENEHVTMAIAQKLGFNVPPFCIFETPQLGKVFAIRRFDRTQEGEWLRMEDFGQILEAISDDKYTKSYNKIAKALRSNSDAVKVDLIAFWRRLLFSFFIGNGDMHLKNWSLLEKENLDSHFRLSPCYDFLNTRLPLPKEKFELAIPLNGRQNNLNGRLFLEFAQQLKITREAVNILDELPRWKEVTEEFVSVCYLSDWERELYLEIVEERYQRLLKI